MTSPICPNPTGGGEGGEGKGGLELLNEVARGSRNTSSTPGVQQGFPRGKRRKKGNNLPAKKKKIVGKFVCQRPLGVFFGSHYIQHHSSMRENLCVLKLVKKRNVSPEKNRMSNI